MIPFLDAALRAVHKQCYDDVIDRLNYYYSTMILLFLSILTTAKQYVGKPIQCWVPAQFRGGWEQYAENYCFIQNTYYIPFDKDIPKDIVERDYKKIGYYQWVPVVLAIQALLFYMPNMLWKLMNWQSGVNVKNILKMATSADLPEKEKREDAVKTLSKYFKDSLEVQSMTKYNPRQHRGSLISWTLGRRANSYLSGLYLFTKLLYLLNVTGQLFLMNAFLGTEYNFWGWQILVDLINGREWTVSGHFPRVTLCDFSIREMGNNIHNHSVQCVLMINMFNEKIYIFLWFWMLLVAAATAVNFTYWLLVYMPRGSRDRMVGKYLRVAGDFADAPGDGAYSRFATSDFSANMLKMDGALLLRFIGTHAGDMVAAELTHQLFDDYKCQNHKREKERTTSTTNTTEIDRVPLSQGFHENLYDPEKEALKPENGSGGDLVDGLPPVPPKPTPNGIKRTSPTLNGYPGPPKMQFLP